LNRLIEARDSSVRISLSQAAAVSEREYRRSPKECLTFTAGPSEKICRTVTNVFVKRYRWPLNRKYFIAHLIRNNHGPLDKAVLFYFIEAFSKEAQNEQKENSK
jgi:hypothetical protein